MDLALSAIRDDGGTQPRELINPFTVAAYSADMQAGAHFPPVTVFYDGAEYWLADGYHRLAAARQLAWSQIAADVRQGTRRDAVLFSVGANATHGLARTNEDKRRAVLTLLNDAEWVQWSDHEIARRCAVGHDLVRQLRPSLAVNASENRTYTTKHGTVATMNTARIGKPPAASIRHKAIPFLQKHAPPEMQDSLAEGTLSIQQAYQQTRRAVGEQTRQDATSARLTTVAAVPPSDRWRLHCADVAQAGELLGPHSVDVILTDPPYPRDFLPVYRTLGEVAAYVLRPGGSLFVMAGQSYLPEIIAALTPSLQYQWTLAYLTPGGQAVQLWQRNVNTFWKPVLWFVNGPYDGPWIGDVSRSRVNDNDKRFHVWGQSESGMADLVERCTRPGDWVLDPFVGGGTTAVTALALQRRFIGIDQDATAIETTRTRLASLESEIDYAPAV